MVELLIARPSVLAAMLADAQMHASGHIVCCEDLHHQTTELILCPDDPVVVFKINRDLNTTF